MSFMGKWGKTSFPHLCGDPGSNPTNPCPELTKTFRKTDTASDTIINQENTPTGSHKQAAADLKSLFRNFFFPKEAGSAEI